MMDRCYSKSYLGLCDRSIVGQTLEFATLFREVMSAPETSPSPVGVSETPVGSGSSSAALGGGYYPGDAGPSWEGIAQGWSFSSRRLIGSVEVALHGSTEVGANFIDSAARAAGLRPYGAVDIHPYRTGVRTSFGDLRSSNEEPQRILRKWLRLNKVGMPSGNLDLARMPFGHVDWSEGQLYWGRSYWVLDVGDKNRLQPVVEIDILQWNYPIGDQTTQLFSFLIPSRYNGGAGWVERDPSKTMRAANKFQERIKRCALRSPLDEKAFRNRVAVLASVNPRLAEALKRMDGSFPTAGKSAPPGAGESEEKIGLKALAARLRDAFAWARATNANKASPLAGVIDDLRRQEADAQLSKEQEAEFYREMREELLRIKNNMPNPGLR
jgi:hypothetical protein